MGVLVLAELDADGLADASLRAVSLARELGGPVAVAVFGSASGDAAAAAATLADYGVSDIYEISLDGYAPQAWGRALAGLASEIGASAVLAAGTDHGNEVLAHAGAITGLPMAANVVSVSPGEPLSLTRQRWAGLLLEDALLEAPVALLTVATDAVAATPAEVASEPVTHSVQPEVSATDL
ncbi:MAG: hypothetical protein ABSA93_21990, partial [Streptosporangiaceae bacterium]